MARPMKGQPPPLVSLSACQTLNRGYYVLLNSEAANTALAYSMIYYTKPTLC